jgi:hypothetical protein
VSHNLIEPDAVPAGQIGAFPAKRVQRDAEALLNGFTVNIAGKGLTCRSADRIVLTSNVNNPSVVFEELPWLQLLSYQGRKKVTITLWVSGLM